MHFPNPCCRMRPPLTGGCRQDYIRSVIAGSIPAAGKRRKSCQSSRPPLFRYGRQMPEELHSTSEGRGFESRPAANKLLWQDSSGVEHRKRISPTPSCLLYHPFSGTADRCLGKLQLIRVSQVRILPRPKRVGSSVGRASAVSRKT